MNRRIVMVAAAAVVALAGCVDNSRSSAPPDMIDEWVPPAGVNLDSEEVYRENRSLFDYDDDAPLDVQSVGEDLTDVVDRYEVTYASPRGGRVPATLFVPEGAGPFAGIVMSHGGLGGRESMVWFAPKFAQMGAVVITIDAPSSRPEHTGSGPVPPTFTPLDREQQIQLIVDLRRAIDLLVSRPDVDPERLAFFGVSYGGAMGGLLAGVEDRLRAYVLQTGHSGPVSRHYTPGGGRGRQAWLEAMWPIEPIHYVGHAAPAALLFQHATEDQSVSPSEAVRFQEAGSEPKTILWYESGHILGKEATDDAVEWLRDHVGSG